MTERIHQHLVHEIQRRSPLQKTHDEGYHGTEHLLYGVKAAELSALVKELKATRELGYDQWLDLLGLLYTGQSYEERALAGRILATYPDHRAILPLAQLHEWLGELVGWAEIDSTCQSTFLAEEILERWQEWEPFLHRLSRDQYIGRRRASLVLLTRPVRESSDLRLTTCATQNITQLMRENDILITKAISWLLREMTKRHETLVRELLERYKGMLPAVAYRETKHKLDTGKK